jgi:hypothetical protein
VVAIDADVAVVVARAKGIVNLAVTERTRTTKTVKTAHLVE